eukprot:jgi/Hompol1/3149/HPOL_006367-RA
MSELSIFILTLLFVLAADIFGKSALHWTCNAAVSSAAFVVHAAAAILLLALRATLFVESAATAFPERLYSLAILTKDAAYDYAAQLVYSMVKDKVQAAISKNDKATRRESLRLRRRMLDSERSLKCMVAHTRKQAKLDAETIENLKAELQEQQRRHLLLVQCVQECQEAHDNRIHAIEHTTKMHTISISESVVVSTFLITEGTRIIATVDSEIKSLKSAANDSRLVLDKLSAQVAKISDAVTLQNQLPSG